MPEPTLSTPSQTPAQLETTPATPGMLLRRSCLRWAGWAATGAALGLAGCGAPVRPAKGAGYRQTAARHLYQRYAARIYQGKLPPMLHAVGSLEVTLSPSGRVLWLHWLRAPTHAPEAISAIENMVRAASPFPAPGGIGSTRYVDTWLWDYSGRFQLDTLTEGQLSQ